MNARTLTEIYAGHQNFTSDIVDKAVAAVVVQAVMALLGRARHATTFGF